MFIIMIPCKVSIEAQKCCSRITSKCKKHTKLKDLQGFLWGHMKNMYALPESIESEHLFIASSLMSPVC